MFQIEERKHSFEENTQSQTSKPEHITCMMEGEDLPNEEIPKNSTNPTELLTDADFERAWDLEHLRPVHGKIPYPEMAGVTINTLDDFKQFLGRFVVVHSNDFYICHGEVHVYGYLEKFLAPSSTYSLRRLIPAEHRQSECALHPARTFKISVPTPKQYEEILEKLRSGWFFELHGQMGADEVNAQRMKLSCKCCT